MRRQSKRKPAGESCEEDDYGIPSGLTAERGRMAHAHVATEVLQLIQMIERHGMPVVIPEQQGAGGRTGETLILFGDLWEQYVTISDKVVGMLIRARKHGLLYFEGETLFERRDYGRPILLLMDEAQAEQALNGGGGGDSFRFGSITAA